MIDRLFNEIANSGLLSDIEVGDGIVIGRARVRAAEADVWVNVDPELEEEEAPDPAVLVRGIQRILDVSPEQWRVIVDEVVDEIEAAVGDEPVKETTPLRAELALKSVVVFASATLLRFEAPRQFPDSWIHVQLDEALAFEDLAVDARDPDVQTVSFDTLDDLLDHISAEDPAQASPGSPQAGPAAERKK